MNRQYTGVDRSPQLRHWKYIKKKRGKNGKWIYYYDKEKLKDDLGFDERDARDKAELENRAVGAALRVQEQTVKENKERYASNGIVNKQGAKVLRDSWAAKEALSEKYIETGKKYIQAHKAYMETPLGKLEYATEKVSKFFSRLFGEK